SSIKPVVVDDDRNARARKESGIFSEDFKRRYDFDMPANASRKVHDTSKTSRKRCAVAKRAIEVETDAPNALIGKSRQRPCRHRLRIDDRDTAAPAPEFCKGFEQEAVVCPIETGLNDHEPANCPRSRSDLQLLERRNVGEISAFRYLR